VAPLYFIGAFVVYSYATVALEDGAWASLIVDFLEPVDCDIRRLLGARSKFVWSGLAMLYVPMMVFTSAFSLTIIARRAGPYSKPVVGALVILASALGVAVLFLGAGQWSAGFVDACGEGCAPPSTGFPFSVVPYMGDIFCHIYEPPFVAFFRRFLAVAGPVHIATLTLFFAAALSLIVGPRSIEQWTIEDLRQRVSDFLVILLLGSVILTHTGLSELTLWGWLVEIANGWPHAEKLRNLQLGSALFWGMCNSALMLLVFAPIGVLLARQARALSHLHNEGASVPALEAWERQHGVTLRGRALWPQIGGVLAPLLTGALAFLFEMAVGSG
jgi:hypothetical protein